MFKVFFGVHTALRLKLDERVEEADAVLEHFVARRQGQPIVEFVRIHQFVSLLKPIFRLLVLEDHCERGSAAYSIYLGRIECWILDVATR